MSELVAVAFKSDKPRARDVIHQRPRTSPAQHKVA
jgi:hypothetical protein